MVGDRANRHLVDQMCIGTARLCTGKLYIDRALMQGCVLRAINKSLMQPSECNPMLYAWVERQAKRSTCC